MTIAKPAEEHHIDGTPSIHIRKMWAEYAKQNGTFKAKRLFGKGTIVPSFSSTSLIPPGCLNTSESSNNEDATLSTTSEKAIQTTTVAVAHPKQEVPEKNTDNSLHKKGLKRYVYFILIALCYSLLGALGFFLIESSYEYESVRLKKTALDNTILNIAEEMTEIINDVNQTVDVPKMIKYLELTYVTLLKQESAYKGSTFYKSEREENLKWSFGSALFFSMNVYTTTGYGSIAPDSPLGKICVIVYGLIFVPFTLILINEFQILISNAVSSVHGKAISSLRRGRRHLFLEDYLTPPVLMCLLVILYLMLTTTFIHVYDNLNDPNHDGGGIGYFLSFYFSYVSISTIGLGDVMPEYITFNPVITVLFFFGMILMKNVNNLTYDIMEKGTTGILSILENHFSTPGHTAKVLHAPVEKPRITSLPTPTIAAARSVRNTTNDKQIH